MAKLYEKCYEKPYPTIKDLIANKDYDYISYRLLLPDEMGGEDEFCGCFASKDGEIVNLDGDTYSLNEPVIASEEWTNEKEGIKNGLTILCSYNEPTKKLNNKAEKNIMLSLDEFDMSGSIRMSRLRGFREGFKEKLIKAAEDNKRQHKPRIPGDTIDLCPASIDAHSEMFAFAIALGTKEVDKLRDFLELTELSASTVIKAAHMLQDDAFKALDKIQ